MFIISEDKTLYCPFCGIKYQDIQEHDYGHAETYRIGDRVEQVERKYKGNEIAEVIYYCTGDCDKRRMNLFNGTGLLKVYIVIKDYTFIGIAPNLDFAESLLELDEGDYYFNRY